jgi:hypothetical protein
MRAVTRAAGPALSRSESAICVALPRYSYSWRVIGIGPGPGAQSRRYGRQADLWPDFFDDDRTGRCARTTSLADVGLCMKVVRCGRT